MADYKTGAKNIKYEYLVTTQIKKTINDYSGITSKGLKNEFVEVPTKDRIIWALIKIKTAKKNTSLL